MYAVEFEATSRDGQIEVPDELRKSLSTRVRVMLPTAEPHQRTQSMIQQLMENPLRVEDPQPLSRSELYSEDMQHGLNVEGQLRIVNPFQPPVTN